MLESVYVNKDQRNVSRCGQAGKGVNVSLGFCLSVNDFVIASADTNKAKKPASAEIFGF